LVALLKINKMGSEPTCGGAAGILVISPAWSTWTAQSGQWPGSWDAALAAALLTFAAHAKRVWSNSHCADETAVSQTRYQVEPVHQDAEHLLEQAIVQATEWQHHARDKQWRKRAVQPV